MNTETVFDIWNNLTKEQKKAIYPLIGMSAMTSKRVAITKDIYKELSKEQRDAVRWILDHACTHE